MDDWEQHFREKSRRRFDKERSKRRRRRMARVGIALLLGASIIGAIVVLAVQR